MDLQQLLKNIGNHKIKKTQEYYGEAKPLTNDLDKNVKIIKETLGYASDLIIREFFLDEEKKQKIALIMFDGLTGNIPVYDSILKPLMTEMKQLQTSKKLMDADDIYYLFEKFVLPMQSLDEVKDFKKCFEKVMVGDSVILIDGSDKAISIDTKGWTDRGVMEPSAESVVRGPRDSFNETIRTNTMLIRRRIRDINLRVVHKEVGEVTKTAVAVMYIEGIANDKIVKEVMERIDRIKIDGILESGYIEQLIRDEPNSIFPTIFNTERPDTVSANLLEGRIALVVDGTPIVLVLPAVFIQFFQAAEDYYHGFYFASFIRILRFLALVLALLTPSVYVAVTTFHQEMLPTPLLVSIASQREGIPFPAFVEAILMEITFEILREAGVRMPKAIGSAISIVGALVLGEAAVAAGIVSSIMVIIVSVTAITSLIFPSYNMATSVRMLRFGFMLVAASFGLYGIGIGIMFLVLHLCSLRSFGVPYMYPLAPFNLQGLKDAIIRVPITQRFKRPSLITGSDSYRQEDPSDIGPQVPNDKEEKNE